MRALALRFRSLLIGIACLLLSAGLVFAGGGFELLGDNDGATGGSAPAVTENGDGEDAWGNHGDLVSEAAQMDTPVAADGTEGFKNHGAFVSCVAKLAYGKKSVEAPADFDLAKLTPEDCDGDNEEEVVTDDPVVEDAWANHGDLVSEAAQMATPVAAEGTEGFKNHGAFVSCVAKLAYGKKGSEAPAGFTLAGLTPEACEQAEEDATAGADDGPGKSAKAKAKGHGKGKGRGRGG